MTETQNYSNHVRWHPPFHYFALPMAGIHVVWSAVQLFRDPGFDRLENLLFAAAMAVAVVLTRVSALKAQDRVIRLEEQLRYQRVLPADLAARASALPVNQIVALRFASDGELAGLAQRVLDGQLKSSTEIKQAVKSWRADHVRV